MANEHSRRTVTELFWEVFPFYLACGMTAYQYWDDDCILVVAYRKKDKLERDRKNQEMWMQGLYVYEALVRVSPLLHAFAKKGTRAENYLDKPYPLTLEAIEEDKANEERTKKEATKAKLIGWAEAVNAKMRKKNEQS